jgi:endonuclease YncB( thermonuclease family)
LIVSTSAMKSFFMWAERRGRAVLFALALLSLLPTARAADLSGLAVVNEDATLSLHERDVALWGIHIPQSVADCETYSRPAGCGAQASLALKTRVRGFVQCERQAQRGDGVIEARCRVDEPGYDTGLDLAAWLIDQGWAVPLPDAPFEYHVLERLARQTGRGLWGVPGVLP